MYRRHWPLVLIIGSAFACCCLLLHLLPAASRQPLVFDGPPRRNIVFFKTHKCASSTVQNILLRHATANNLTVLLPHKLIHLGKIRNQTFRPRLIVPLPSVYGNEYNVVAHHTRWNLYTETEIGRRMPQDTVYFTIVRDPAQQFTSTFNYEQLDQYFGVSINEFLRRPALYQRLKPSRFSHNQMLYDFGMEKFDNPITVLETIQRLERRFELVLLADRFAESMLLLRRLLRWPLQDLVALHGNARPSSAKTANKEPNKQLIYRWNAADKMLYDHFRAIFDRKVLALGDVREELDELRRLNEETVANCQIERVQQGRSLAWEYRPWRAGLPGFVPRGEGLCNETCRSLARGELPFTSILRQRQWPERFHYSQFVDE